jgi:hypothetical protein
MSKSFLVLFFKKEHFLLLALLLCSCGDLPRPYAGNPGATAERLSVPPPGRLAIPVPGAAFLTEADATRLAVGVREGLVSREVPVFAGPAQRGDWPLVITARTTADRKVVLTYSVSDPAGKPMGTIDATPIDAAAWVAARPSTLTAAIDDAVPKLADLLTRIEATRRESDPNSLVNRPTKLAFAGVTGAPGDGNQSLARRMRDELIALGQVLQDHPDGADYQVSGQVTVSPMAGDQQQVEIVWLVRGAKGDEAGKVAQLNEVKRGTLDHYWGDIAVVVAHEAAYGVRDVILNQIGRGKQDRPGALPLDPAKGIGP